MLLRLRSCLETQTSEAERAVKAMKQANDMVHELELRKAMLDLTSADRERLRLHYVILVGIQILLSESC